MSPWLCACFPGTFLLQPPWEERIFPAQKIHSVNFFWCDLIFVTKRHFPHSFFFSEQKNIQFPPEEDSGLEIPTLAFSDSKALENMVPWAANFQRWDDVVTVVNDWHAKTVTVVIPATSDSILIDTSHLCFLLNLRCDMQGVYSDSFSWDKVCFVPWTRNLSGSLNPQSHSLLLISSLPTSCKAANETIESHGSRDAGVKLLNFPGLRCQKRFGRCSYLNSNWMTWTWLVST